MVLFLLLPVTGAAPSKKSPLGCQQFDYLFLTIFNKKHYTGRIIFFSQNHHIDRGKAKPEGKESGTPLKPESLGGRRALQPGSPPTGKANPKPKPNHHVFVHCGLRTLINIEPEPKLLAPIAGTRTNKKYNLIYKVGMYRPRVNGKYCSQPFGRISSVPISHSCLVFQLCFQNQSRTANLISYPVFCPISSHSFALAISLMLAFQPSLMSGSKVRAYPSEMPFRG